MRRRDHVPDERGQSFLLIPAGFMILLVMGALVLEAAALHLHQRQLNDIADSVASDAAGLGFDLDAFRTDGTLQIDRELAVDGLQLTIDYSNLRNAELRQLAVTNGANPTVEVTLTYDHDYVIGRALLGGTSKELSATGQATLIVSAP